MVQMAKYAIKVSEMPLPFCSIIPVAMDRKPSAQRTVHGLVNLVSIRRGSTALHHSHACNEAFWTRP